MSGDEANSLAWLAVLGYVRVESWRESDGREPFPAPMGGKGVKLGRASTRRRDAACEGVEEASNHL